MTGTTAVVRRLCWPRRKRRYPADIDHLALLKARSVGLCEAWTPVCTHWAARVHRRVRGSRFAADPWRRDRLANLLHTCAPCLAWIEAGPGRAAGRGLSLRGSLLGRQEPTAVALRYRDGWAYLDDAGGVHRLDWQGPLHLVGQFPGRLAHPDVGRQIPGHLPGRMAGRMAGVT